jgi:uncharacterized protein (PEP-CTERM system associated)
MTFTNNVNLQPDTTRRSDFVTQITPGFTIDARSPYAQLTGTLSAPMLLYVETGEDNNRVLPQVNLLGRVDAIKDKLWVEGAAYVQQEYFTAFGARSASLSNNPSNQYTGQSFRVTPVLAGDIGGTIGYQLLNDSIWTNLSGEPIDVSSSYTNRTLGNVTRSPAPLGWGVDYERTQIEFSERNSQVLQLARVRGIWQADPQLRVSIFGGYESNDFVFTETSGSIYGVGVRWRPTERTDVDAFWEHRFFGSSYAVTAAHRTPLTVAQLSASRNITSYPQALATLPAGVFVPSLLDPLFTSRFPDPAERAQAILTFMQQQGLPVVLSDPFSIYTEQFFLEENFRLTPGLLGARNTLFMNVFRVESRPITGAGDLPIGALAAVNNNTQWGAGVVWTRTLSSHTTLVTSADVYRTEANEPFEGRTDQGSLRVYLTRTISARTTVYTGGRWQKLRSNFTDGFEELAVFAGINYAFH